MTAFNLSKTDRKIAVLIDPDKHGSDALFDFASKMNEMAPDFIMVGGSLILNSTTSEAAKQIKAASAIPLVLFPGHFTHLTHEVDAVLLLSLISGRNPDLLIGQHVLAAPMLKAMGEKIHSTGYVLIDGGRQTSVSYMSHTMPIPSDKIDIAVATAIAGQFIGMKSIYLDAGSGAITPVNQKMIHAVAEAIDIPLIVGGGIRTLEAIDAAWQGGANLVVMGNAFEENETLFSKVKAMLTAFR